ncbi:MAG: nitroreductase family deazaflavin-dependent oxidoreductase [Roseiflexaceae bacterium]|nr:nitroreductase family deazaflavin-dependent oxidoreductase [Roseiflexaceae bacterium]
MTQTPAHTTPPRRWRLLMKAVNPFMVWLLRSPLHGVVSHLYLLITFTGRKSGRVYTTPVQYAQQGELLSIITSEGYPWWQNLRGGAAVQVHLRGKTSQGYAETSTDVQTINALLQKSYPGLSSDQRARVASGMVVITVALQGQKEAASYPPVGI